MMKELPPSEVFTRFDNDVSPRTIVKDTNADPDTILKLYQIWVDMHREEAAVMIWKRLKTLLEGEAPAGEVAEVASKMTKILETAEKSKETRTPEYWLKRFEKKGHS